MRLHRPDFLVEVCKERVEKHFIGYVLDVESGNTEDGVESALNYLKRQRHKMMLYTMYSEYERYERIIRRRRKDVPGGKRVTA